MIIRKSKPEESYAIASCIVLAMKDIICYFIGEESSEKAIHFLNCLIQEKGNQYSYENCWVVEFENEIIAAAIVYDGARLKELRKPIEKTVKLMFNRDFNPEDETHEGEYYIDCVGVKPNQQGKGIGTKVFQFLINEYAIQKDKTLGLLVDKSNPKAKKLYVKLGFEIVDEKILAGKKMDHLQFKNKQR